MQDSLFNTDKTDIPKDWVEKVRLIPEEELDLTIQYAFYENRFGNCLIASTAKEKT